MAIPLKNGNGFKSNHLLVAVDGSLPALNALQFAAALLHGREQGLIHLINVQPLILPLGEYPDFDTLEKAQRQYAQNILKHAKHALMDTHIPVISHFEIGPVAEGIINCAHTHKVDHIIMGTRGMGALGNLCLGSVANRVVHLANLPVTLIK
jgi:nucleotide-binding universal stress UspA family protein